MTDFPKQVSAVDLTGFCIDIFTAAGLSNDHARQWADMLVWANLRGVDSHGVLRIPRYMDLLAEGSIKPKPEMTVATSAGATCVLDADRAPGAVGMNRALDEAIARAKQVHIGWCVARDITHAGAVGFFAEKAARAGMIGMVMTASRPMMAYYGAADAGVSTNPLAMALPRTGHDPIVFDMSTAKIPFGKILSARDKGEMIPDDWGLDAAGQPTNDPAKVKTVLPLGGPKGSGLSLMIECLTSLAASNPVLEPILTGKPPDRLMHMNGLAVVIDLAAFGGLETFGLNVDALAEALTGLPKMAGVERLYMPGERGGEVAVKRLAEGIPMPKGTWDRLGEVASKYNIAMPQTA